MPDFIEPVVKQLVTVLQGMDETYLGDLPAFQFVGRAWTGNLMNPPSAWVMPVRTQFPDGGDSTARNQNHQATIRLGIQGTDPETLMERVLQYVAAVDAAITAVPLPSWPVYVLHVFIAEHDYGPMYTRGNALAVWPDLHLMITTEELP